MVLLNNSATYTTVTKNPNLAIEIPTLDNLQVDLLIGADNIQCLLVNETRVGKEEQPMGIHTSLGWALSRGIRSVMGGVLLLTSLQLVISLYIISWNECFFF